MRKNIYQFGQKIFSSGGGECRRAYFVYVQGAKRRITEKDLSKKEVTLDCRSINFPTLNTAKGYFSETLVSNINLTSLSSDFIYIFIGYHPFWL